MAKPNIKKLLKKAIGWLWSRHKDEIADKVIEEAEKVKREKG